MEEGMDAIYAEGTAEYEQAGMSQHWVFRVLQVEGT